MSNVSYALFDTAVGRCGIAWSDCGLLSVQLPEANDAATRARLRTRSGDAREAVPTGAAKDAVDAITAYLRGDETAAKAMAQLALDMTSVPPFHARVYEALRHLPAGATIGYGELASRIGSSGAARAVGQAVSKNPWPVIVPCHRVLAVGGRAGGFSAYGGIETKRRLLAIEGVTLETKDARKGLPSRRRGHGRAPDQRATATAYTRRTRT